MSSGTIAAALLALSGVTAVKIGTHRLRESPAISGPPEWDMPEIVLDVHPDHPHDHTHISETCQSIAMPQGEALLLAVLSALNASQVKPKS